MTSKPTPVKAPESRGGKFKPGLTKNHVPDVGKMVLVSQREARWMLPLVEEQNRVKQ